MNKYLKLLNNSYYGITISRSNIQVEYGSTINKQLMLISRGLMNKREKGNRDKKIHMVAIAQ